MSPDNFTPEWFQMAQADPIAPRPRGKRIVRIMALATPLFVLGAGLVFAQTQESPTAVASSSTSAAATSSDPIALASAPVASAPVASAPAASVPVSTTIQVSQATPASTAQTVPSAPTIQAIQGASTTIKKPAISTLPTGGGEDGAEEGSNDDD